MISSRLALLGARLNNKREQENLLMMWTEINSVLSHPELGSIAQLADGKWQITFPTGERAEPDDDLAHSKLSAEAVWGGWVKGGADKWTHPRHGSIQKRTLD